MSKASDLVMSEHLRGVCPGTLRPIELGAIRRRCYHFEDWMDFRILGPLEVLDQGRRVSVRRGKEQALLAYLETLQ